MYLTADSDNELQEVGRGCLLHSPPFPAAVLSTALPSSCTLPGLNRCALLSFPPSPLHAPPSLGSWTLRPHMPELAAPPAPLRLLPCSWTPRPSTSLAASWTATATSCCATTRRRRRWARRGERAHCLCCADALTRWIARVRVGVGAWGYVSFMNRCPVCAVPQATVGAAQRSRRGWAARSCPHSLLPAALTCIVCACVCRVSRTRGCRLGTTSAWPAPRS